ncbi:3',5'-cyclic adenosine monophosphate phosphodiesterase CpdA [compost metagenome]
MTNSAKTLVILFSSLIMSCVPLKNSPFSEETETNVQNLNQIQFEKLNATPLFAAPAQDIVFAAISDTHQNYDDLKKWVQIANKQKVDFVIHTGDFTNQGLNFEYDLYLNLMAPLNKPYFTVIGNHDTVTKGKLLYRRLIGPYNSSFVLSGHKFILFNNNRLDFFTEGVDWDWLAREVRSSPYPVVLFNHIDPDNNGYFTQAERDRYWGIVEDSQVRLIMNGHEHVFKTEVRNGVLRHQIARIEGLNWARVTLKENDVSIENCQAEECRHEIHQAYDSGLDSVE